MEFTFLVLIICASLGFSAGEDFHCAAHDALVDSSEYLTPVCYTETCATKIKAQVEEEFRASFAYMYMAAYFDQESVNRPGLAKFLYHSASEERSHGIQMLDYLNSRGIAFEEDFELEDMKIPDQMSYMSALQMVLNLEIVVTKKIYDIVKGCEEDFHGADVFTNPILDEQHNGIRHLQGLIKELDDMTKSSSEAGLAEFLFDAKMAAA